MKLISMHVDDFGGLHNYDYAFDEGLNVVLHDNGWGKTTMAAFLKAMLYGYDSKRSKDITENERKRYLPWQGGKYGGYLDFEAEGVRYRIYRTFGETPRFDTVKIVNLDTKTTARIPADKIGETLFHLDASAFQRSIFINQNGLSITGAASSIHARLNTLVSQANDVSAYDGAIASLTQEIKVYEKTGARGMLGDITRQISLLEQTRDQQEKVIDEQDIARERISEIDILLNAINKDLEEKNNILDEISSEGKRREATRKLLDDIDSQMGTIREQIEDIRAALGGHVPSQTEIDQVKAHTQTIISIKLQIEELEGFCAKLTEEYNELLDKYNGSLPSAAQLDQIQGIYGEMQGLKTSDEQPEPETDAPEEYLMIKAVADEDQEYISRLQSSVGMQVLFQTLIRKLDSANSDLKKDADSWAEKAKRYEKLKTEVERLQKDVEEEAPYAPSILEPVISRLEDLQRKLQIVAVKKETLSSESLTPEQENLLKNNTGKLPDLNEGNEILKICRSVARQKAEIQGLTARLDGEKSKAESLSASLSQLDGVTALDMSEPEEPRKSFGTVLIGAGVMIAILGVILGVVVMPPFFAAAAAGGILMILGIVNNNNYNNKVKAYNAWQSASERNHEALRKREELLTQQSTVQTSVTSLECQITDLQKEIKSNAADVAAWFDKWAANEENRSETAVIHILEKTETIEKLRKRQEETSATRAFIDKETDAIESLRSDIDTIYPECSGKSVSEALSFLRGKLSEFLVTEKQLQTAVRNEDQFVKESGTTKEALERTESPKAEELTSARDTVAAELQTRLENANKDLAPLDLDTDPEHIVQALREAEEMLNEYKLYADRLNDHAERQKKKRQQEEVIQKKLSEALLPVSSKYPEKEIPERLTIIRGEIGRANQLKEKISDSETELERKRTSLVNAYKSVDEFKETYGRLSVKEDILLDIYEKAGDYSELITAMKQLENQRMTVGKDQENASGGTANEEEASLRAEIERLNERRDSLLIEYTQKGDFIRQADQSLEMYPDTVREIHALYDKKQKVQNKLAILKRAIQLITKAKENLANRYLSRVENLFNSYLHIWLNNDAVRGLLDIDFNIKIEENDNVHVTEGYSTGYCDLIDFCMRLALVDTLFENEQPFLILDDPFVNLDADRLEKALELLNVMAANKQIVYFVCHPIRAVETEKNSKSRAEFMKLAEATRQKITEHKDGAVIHKKTVSKSPKEMYKMGRSATSIPFKPAKQDYIITNNIFSMNFVPTDSVESKDSFYELFFIDEVGHVLNDRQIIEVYNGKLSTERVQFCLNTRDDSGNEYELMVRESGQDDYEVSARFPFNVKMAFTGTFNFDI